MLIRITSEIYNTVIFKTHSDIISIIGHTINIKIEDKLDLLSILCNLKILKEIKESIKRDYSISNIANNFGEIVIKVALIYSNNKETIVNVYINH